MMTRLTIFILIFANQVVTSFTACVPQPPAELVKDAVSLTGTTKLNESSGLVFSTRDPNCVWTHNDSGNSARLYAFDHRTGELTGECRLTGVKAVDWESLTTAGLDYQELIVADCGDNDALRKHLTMYRFEEPDPHRSTKLSASEFQTLHVRFPDGPADCEAVWYDAGEENLMLMTKGRLALARVYRVADSQWSDSQQRQRAPGVSPVVEAPVEITTAFKVTSVALPMATGADLDRASGDIWVSSYFQAFCFPRGDHSSVQEQLSAVPIAVEMPRWRQIEAIAVDNHSQVWITSEGNPTKLGRLK
ncbi:hypothetical protein [Allorhodopirellula heiligendammensis]|uniref:Integral membrane protein n=1 Tax=Allorhodopirellula heiligendammensis TaxID=2714739 RepID=A0A5C6BET9_9BACT|nr:hypothetical protein [Allorhodopirellula heiligendammensis]TWU10643.1 hypothetical protein Poly21_45490 [Allorhodopirellula heiligendammensis]